MKKSTYTKNRFLSFNNETRNLAFFNLGLIPLTTNIKAGFLSKRLVTALFTLFTFFTMNAQPPMLRLQMAGPNNFLDETILYYQNGASLGFDSDFDAYKLSGPNPHAIIAAKYDNITFQINGIDQVQQYLAMPVLVTSPQTTTYTIFATDFNDMPYGTCIKLLDTYNGNVTDIKNTDYTFVSYDTTSAPRFLLEISYMSMPLTVQLKHADCSNALGNFIAQGDGTTPINYIWKDNQGNTIKTRLNTTLSDTLNPVSGGDYKLYVESNVGCGYSFHEFTIDSVVLPSASFDSPDTIFTASSENFLAINTSANAINYMWNYGDGTSLDSANINGNHNYEDSGMYVVQLIAYNNYGCSDTSYKTLFVSDSTTTIINSVGLQEEKQKKSIKWCTLGENRFLVNNPEGIIYQLDVFDIFGKKIFSEKSEITNRVFELGGLSKGTYTIFLSSEYTIQKTLCILY